MTDHELVLAILSDKQSKEGQMASSILYRRYRAKFRRFIRSKRMPISRSMEETDVVLIALNKMLSKLEQYSFEFAFSTWAFNIAQNTLIDQHRQRVSEKKCFPNRWQGWLSITYLA